MRLIGLTILATFNTIVSVLILVLLYALFRLNFELIEGVTDNAGFMSFLFIGVVIVVILWLALYQLYKLNRRAWLLFYLLVGVVLTVLNIQFLWFFFLMLIYFAGIVLLFLDKSFIKEEAEEES